MQTKKVIFTTLPDAVTMQSIEYNIFGLVKKITFRPLDEIIKHFPEFTEKHELPKSIMMMKE
jgi:hypothetical protein